MDWLQALHHLYETYEETAKAVRRKASRYAGAFGLGDDPRKHDCHEKFFEDVGCWVHDFLKDDPAPGDVTQAVCWILKAADAHRNTDVYWHMYAAQGHAKSLILQISREDSIQLLQWYVRAYPEGDWLPVQQEVYQLLRKQSGIQEGSSRCGFWKLFRRT